MRTVFKNGRIFQGTSNDKDDADLCLITNGDVIEYVGASKATAVTDAEQAGASVVDLAGRTLAPGFIDGHMHLLAFGSSLKKVELDRCNTLEEIRRTIKNAAQANPSAPRILCQGWMHFMTDSKALASDLDDLDPRPIFIDAKDLHSTWCNTAALKEMNVLDDMPDPPGGEIFRDENGKATGLMSEAAAVSIVWPHLAKVASMEEKLNAMREAIKAYNTAGYTGMVEMAMDEDSLGVLEELRSKEDLSVRLAMHWLITPSKTNKESLEQVDRAIALHKKYNLESSPNFRIAGIKVIGDGVVDACTAALMEPYSSNGISCDPLWDAAMLEQVVKRADGAGLQCAIHAIGDATVKLAIDALEKVSPKGKRHRIEHLEMTNPGDAKRLNDLGITASVQAVHADPAIFRAWPKLLGLKRCKRAFAYGEFLNSGVHLALGTDAPTAPSEPLPNLYIATTRRSAREPDSTETVNPEFALPLLNALSAATAGSAYSCFADKITGALEKGKKADLVVLDMQWSPEKLLEAKVSETWFDGRKVFG